MKQIRENAINDDANKDAEIERLRDAIMCISVMAANQHEDIYDYATFILYDEKALAGGEGEGC